MRLLFVAISVAAAVCQLTGASAGEAKSVHPVLIVPGTQGNRIEARLNKTQVVRSNCAKTSDWYTLWFNPIQFLPGVVDCWIDNFKLAYNNETGEPKNQPGVETRIPGFGETETVEYLNPIKWLYGYMDLVVKSLVKIGYVRGKTVRAAPYDFRYAPSDNTELLGRVKALIETMYSDAGNKSVILLSHSGGSRYSYYFLSQQTPEWKDKFIARWVTIAGSIGGEVVTLAILAAGVYDGTRGLSRDNVRGLFRTYSSYAFGSPDPLAFEDDVIFQIKDKNFKASQLGEIYDAIDHREGIRQLKKTKQLIQSLDSPGVKVTCLRGSGTPTIEKIVYADESDLLDKAELIRGDGDGNVNTKSLSVCERWSDSDGFDSAVYPGVKHLDLLRNKKVLNRIIETVNRVNEE